MAQAVVDMADSVLAAHIVAVAAAALRAAAGFGIAADIADIVDIVVVVVFVGMVAAAHIVEEFALDSIARRARSAVQGIALAARIAAAAVDNFARGMGFAADSARAVGGIAAAHSFVAVLGIVVVARIVAGFGMALAAPAGNSSARGSAR